MPPTKRVRSTPASPYHGFQFVKTATIVGWPAPARTGRDPGRAAGLYGPSSRIMATFSSALPRTRASEVATSLRGSASPNGRHKRSSPTWSLVDTCTAAGWADGTITRSILTSPCAIPSSNLEASEISWPRLLATAPRSARAGRRPEPAQLRLTPLYDWVFSPRRSRGNERSGEPRPMPPQYWRPRP